MVRTPDPTVGADTVDLAWFFRGLGNAVDESPAGTLQHTGAITAVKAGLAGEMSGRCRPAPCLRLTCPCK